MKSKDLLLIGGIGLAAYLLMPRGKPKDATGLSTIIMPSETAAPFDISGLLSGLKGIMPSPAEPAAPFDIGGLLSGLTDMLGGVSGSVIPELNIPELKLPDIDIPELNIPDLPELTLPDLPDELKIPSLPELTIPSIPDIPSLIPSLIPDIPSLIPDIPSFIKDMLPDINIDTFKWAEWTKDFSKGIEAIGTGTGTTLDFILGGWQEASPIVKSLIMPSILPLEFLRDLLIQRDIVKTSEYAESIKVPETFLEMTVSEREAYYEPPTREVATQPESTTEKRLDTTSYFAGRLV